MNSVALILLAAGLAHGAHDREVSAQRASFHVSEQKCLAQAIYYEARGEIESGQRAVAEVVIERTKLSYRPHTICGVVFEPWQFSFTVDGSMKAKRDREAWGDAMELAESVMSGNPRKKQTFSHGATYFARYDVEAPWIVNMVAVAEIGDHVFYRLKSKAERATMVAGS